MGKDEFEEDSEAAKKINAWRQSERKIMIDTLQDLIQTSHKYAKSQYTPQVHRARWTKLAGQLIWYKDQIMKNFSLEAMHTEFEALKKLVIESEERRERESMTRNYPLIGFRKQGDLKVGDADKGDADKGQDEETDETAEADEPEGAKEIA